MNQIEIYFSIVQRRVLTPNDFPDLRTLEAQRVIAEWIDYYNEERPHSVLDGRTPAEAYRDGMADSTREVA